MRKNLEKLSEKIARIDRLDALKSAVNDTLNRESDERIKIFFAGYDYLYPAKRLDEIITAELKKEEDEYTDLLKEEAQKELTKRAARIE